MFAPGKLVGSRYRLLRLIGQGGMGSVWAAKNEAISRDVAIKVLRPEVLARDPSAIPRFFNEARICGSIRHPGIVDMLDLGQAEDGSPFLVTELLDGQALDAVLAQRRLPAVEILPIVRDVARTIALAHARGVVHRDLKPANLFLHRVATGEVVVKVLDFGVSKFMKPAAAPGKPSAPVESNTIVGSPAYMSPEQGRLKGSIDGRADVYSLGVILYQAISGRFPFDITSYEQLVVDQMTREPPPLAAFASDVPRSVSELVDAALRRDAATRIGSATELADRIDRILMDLGGGVDPRRSGSALPAASAMLAMPAASDAELATWENTGRTRAALPTFPQAMVGTVQSSPAVSTNVDAARQRTSILVVLSVALLVATVGIATIWWTSSRDRAAASAGEPSPKAQSPVAAADTSAPSTAASSSAAPAEAPSPTSAAAEAPSAAPPPAAPADEPAPDTSARAAEAPSADASGAAKRGPFPAPRPGGARVPTKPAKPKADRRVWGYD